MSGQTVKIYFVSGGAVSAGAYTAGVLDYFVDRLKVFMEIPSGVRKYDIKIDAVTGTSAGAMCGAILTIGFAKGWNYNTQESSPLFQAWVRKTGIRELMDTGDLKEGNVKALLNGDSLRKIAADLVRDTPFGEKIILPSFVSDKFRLVLSATNSNGINYSIDSVGHDPENPGFLTDHRDNFKFTFAKTPDNEFRGFNTVTDWEFLVNAALASGAFPVGLPPVLIEKPFFALKGGPLPVSGDRERISYYAIDGSTVGNDPLVILKELLKNGKDEDCEQAVIFIDPFTPRRNVPAGDSIQDSISRLFNVLRNHAAYDPFELDSFFNGKNDSSPEKLKAFCIAPCRDNPVRKDLHLAGGAFNSFGGFLHESFRMHDYLLGKYNCQQFINNYFSFDGTRLVLRTDPGPVISQPEWPCISPEEFRKAGRLINRRMRKIAGKLSNPLFARMLINWLNPSGFIYNELCRNKLVQLAEK